MRRMRHTKASEVQGCTVEIRVDSKSIATATGKTGSVSYTAKELIIGNNSNPPASGLQGFIALLAIYPLALSAPVVRRVEHAWMRKTRIASA